MLSAPFCLSARTNDRGGRALSNYPTLCSSSAPVKHVVATTVYRPGILQIRAPTSRPTCGVLIRILVYFRSFRLNHIYFDPTLKMECLALHRSRTALIASDHLPLVADFRLGVAAPTEYRNLLKYKNADRVERDHVNM